MLRRVSAAAAGSSVCVSDTQVRTYVPIKSRVEYRIPRLYPRKTPQEANEDRLRKEADKKHPSPSNKKEALQHLLQRPDYEYTSCYQRAANDMMAVYGTNGEYGLDMQYHYHKIWRAQKQSGIGREDGFLTLGQKIAPGNQQL